MRQPAMFAPTANRLPSGAGFSLLFKDILHRIFIRVPETMVTSISRKKLETRQIGIYAVAIAIGGVLGLLWPEPASGVEILITPVLAILLYGMFAQIPFLHLRDAFGNRRFIAAVLITNFILVPILVWLLIQLLPNHPPLLLGVLLVLLTPCIDYVVVFTHLGGGNARLMLAATPLLLLAQLILLPFYLWFFMGAQAMGVMKAEPFLMAFLGLIVIPLTLALATESWAKRYRSGQVWIKVTGWLPVPFMALTLMIIVASQIDKIGAQLHWVSQAIPVYVAFLIVTPILARFTGRAFGLDTQAGRALIFSTGTRNSLVVLPLALALPNTWKLTAIVIVTQTLVELVGELLYIHLVPKAVYRD